MAQVITYALAYDAESAISLCGKHDTSEAAGVALGRVTHGLHEGACEVCATTHRKGVSVPRSAADRAEDERCIAESRKWAVPS